MDITGRYHYTVRITATGITLAKYLACGGSGKRCAIKGLSSKSATRLRNFLGSVVFQSADFVTLTYHENKESKHDAYKDLRAWYKRLVRAFGPFCAVWRAERQKRGAVHFHVFALDSDVPIDGQAYRDEWLSVTGGDGDWAARAYGVDVKRFDRLGTDDGGLIMSYLVKYASKGGSVDGRQWGILGRGTARVVDKVAVIDEMDFAAMAEVLRYAWNGHAGQIDGGGEYVVYRPGGVGCDRSAEWEKIVNTVLPWVKFAL